jgi:hypothetical protein
VSALGVERRPAKQNRSPIRRLGAALASIPHRPITMRTFRGSLMPSETTSSRIKRSSVRSATICRPPRFPSPRTSTAKIPLIPAGTTFEFCLRTLSARYSDGRLTSIARLLGGQDRSLKSPKPGTHPGGSSEGESSVKYEFSDCRNPRDETSSLGFPQNRPTKQERGRRAWKL